MSLDASVDHGLLPRSLKPLAEIAARRAGADGHAIYQIDPIQGSRELRFSCGAPVPEPGDIGFTTDSIPLRVSEEVAGLLTFVYRGSAIPPESRGVLEKVGGVIEAVWRLTVIPSVYARSAARVGELEMELADAKINDRAHGMLANGSPFDPVDTLARHVESVLKPGQLGEALTQITVEIEQQISDREIANRAKAVLQSRYGISEEQAHVHLRLVSRKSRRRLSAVAQDVLEEPQVKRANH
jgi:hypothetical protein